MALQTPIAAAVHTITGRWSAYVEFRAVNTIIAVARSYRSD